MDQRADRGGAFHGVGQPDVQRELGALAHAAEKHPQPGNHQQPIARALGPPPGHQPAEPGLGASSLSRGGVDIGDLRLGRGPDHAVGHDQGVIGRGGADLAEDAGQHLPLRPAVIRERKGAQGAPDRHQADDHAEVAHPVDDKRLVAGGGGTEPLVIEPDQQIGADAHQLPEHEDHGRVAGDHQPQHAEREEREVLVEAVEPAAALEDLAAGERDQRVRDLVEFFVHVAQAVDVDARGHQGDHDEHGHGQGVDVVADRDLQRAERSQGVPVAGDRLHGVQRPVTLGARRVGDQPGDQGHQGERAGPADCPDGQVPRPAPAAAHARPKQHDGRERGQRQQPGQSQTKRQYLIQLHQRFSSSAWSTSTVAWTL